MLKRVLSLFLVTVLAFSSFSVGLVNVSAADDTMDKLVYLIKKLPDGKYWNHTGKNNPDGVTSSPCASHYNCDYFGGCSCNSFGNAIQCMGYAAKISYEITGVDRGKYDESYTLDVSKLRVGDIIRSNNHSVCVTGVNGDKISFTDCNYGDRCIIRWVTVDKSWFRGIEYILHLKGNERTNTNVNFHDAYKGTTTDPEIPVPDPEPDEDAPSNAEIWRMDDEGNLNIRSGKSTDSGVIGSVPAGESFNVYEKELSDDYLWAKVEYDGTTGYSVLNYAEYISGAYQTPELSSLKKSYKSTDSVAFKSNAVSGADSYTFSLYSSDKKLIKEYKSSKNSYSLTGLSAGKYYVDVTVSSSIAPSWKLKSESKSFSVTEENVAVTKVSLRKEGSIEVGKSGTFQPVIEPENATNKALTWTSSDEKIATVDSNGVVTGIAPGKVTIKCTSKENSKLSASCEFTVKPASVNAIQTYSGTMENSIGLKWEKSEGATGYTVYRYNPSTKSYVKLAAGNGTSYTDKKLKASTSYTYVVRAYAKTEDGVINAPYKAFTAKTTATAITTVKQTGSDTGRVRIEWEKKSGSDAYAVYKYDFAAGKFRKVGVTTNTSFIDKDKPATKVYYRIVSAVKTGDGYAISKPSGTFMAITGLEKPEVDSSAKGTSVTLSWDKVDYATHYQIYRIVNGKKVLLKTVTSSVTSYTEKNLKSDVTYTYYVRAARKHSSALNLFSSETAIKQKTA